MAHARGLEGVVSVENEAGREHSGMAGAVMSILSGAEAPMLSCLNRKRPHIQYNSGSEDEDEEDPGRTTSVKHHLAPRVVVATYHQQPDASMLEYERKLQRISTKGVVQLFNAVSKQQKEIEQELKKAGPSETKRSKVLASIDKGSFIDMLKGTGTAKARRRRRVAEDKLEEQPSWSVLRDDFMMGSKLKDWDKGREEEGGGVCHLSNDSDLESSQSDSDT